MAQRDQAALGTLYDRHSGVVYATIFAGIVDIDFYPVNGLLYGLNGNGDVFRLDTSTAAATLVASPLTSIAASSVREAVGLAVLLPAIGLLALHRRNSAPAAQA